METGLRRISNPWNFAARAAALLLAAAVRVDAVILASETFDSGSSAWVDRDPLEMVVTYSAGVGNSGGSLHGNFASQGTPFFESDAFRATSSSSAGLFSGNLYLAYTNFSGLTFDFLAEDVLPSTFIVRVGNGVNTFLYNVNPQLQALSSWTTVNVSLVFSAGWIGGTAAQFSNVFNNLSFVDVQVGRNGTGAQDFYFDNFSLLGSTLGDLVLVPEPGSSGLLMLGALALMRARMRRRIRALNARHERP